MTAQERFEVAVVDILHPDDPLREQRLQALKLAAIIYAEEVVKEATAKVNRLEVVDRTRPVEAGGGRVSYEAMVGALGVDLSYQDEGRTLKVFLTPKES